MAHHKHAKEPRRATVINEEVWRKKLEQMSRRVGQIERTNLKIINRIYHIRKYIKQSQRIKRLLIKRLDKHHDHYGDFDTYFDLDVLKESKVTKASKPLEKAHKRQKSSITNHGSVKSDKSSLEKDPNAPKKPVNAFILFCQQKRTEYLRENPSIPHHDLSKLLAKSWNMLGMADKQMYYDMYERDKERYEEELEHYVDKSPYKVRGKGKVVKVKAEPPDDSEESVSFSCRAEFLADRDPRIGATISPTLSDSFPMSSIPSPAMTSQEEDSFAISNIPSLGF